MAELNIQQSATTNLDNTVDTFNVKSEVLDFAGNQKETFWEFPDATQNIGYYKSIPEFKQAVDALARWTVGKGYTGKEEVITTLSNVVGWGEDSFQSIMESMIVMKKVVGDSFAEIIRHKDGRLINLRPISPERVRIVVNAEGIITRYDVKQKNKQFKAMSPDKILHLCNERTADEIHGTSVLDACKTVIDARNEAIDTERKLRRRQLALGILYVDTDNTTERDAIIDKYQDAINKGEVLVLPKDIAEIKDSPVRPQAHIDWITYLENFFYQAVGVPKIILGGSQDFTEASSKIGYLTFEQVYMSEQRLLESDIWNQLAIRIKFDRPVSLKSDIQEDEAANTGQVGVQPNETQVDLTRSE